MHGKSEGDREEMTVGFFSSKRQTQDLVTELSWEGDGGHEMKAGCNNK